jgi:hypothetical protein
MGNFADAPRRWPRSFAAPAAGTAPLWGGHPSVESRPDPVLRRWCGSTYASATARRSIRAPPTLRSCCYCGTQSIGAAPLGLSAHQSAATTHLARATASVGPKAAAVLRRSAFARTRSPSCAIAMPRSASAGASSCRATRFNAPIGSPAANAGAAAVIRVHRNPATIVTLSVSISGARSVA